ncbi:HNH endonuclease signature motif containing protein [Streptomyces sp. NPDC093598]|uniref:HNH endonuclease signature motif containing protein n=1 Tax=Streptomyces sp. NPDC093598 TaxID=3366046 RepID=UPI0037FB00DD
MSTPRYTRELLTRTAAEATSLVDLMRRLQAPMGSGPSCYLEKRLRHYGIDVSHFRQEPLPKRERRSYPEHLLREAAAQSNSIREMVQYMGLTPRDSPYGYIRKKLDAFGIDTSHFTGGRSNRSGALFPREDITRAVAASHSLSGVLRLLGLSTLGGSGRAKVKRSIEFYGLSTGHFTGQGHLRGTSSPRRRSAAQILVRRPPGSPRAQTALLRRALDDLGVPRVCRECGTGENWQGRRLVLEIDHIDGDRLDDRIENLRYLCPSCHSQTQTHSRPLRADTAPGPVQ